jgi:hypothetical protein
LLFEGIIANMTLLQSYFTIAIDRFPSSVKGHVATTPRST